MSRLSRQRIGRKAACTVRLLGIAIVATGSPAIAQSAADNAITSAEDAFGTSVGRESIGIYSTSSVRGFSPTAAGNARIDGLYFDQVWGVTSRLRQSTTIRVGISAQGYPFPAPTGIVDYAFRKPGDEAMTGLTVGGDSYGAIYVEGDAVIPLIAGELSLGIGGAAYRNDYYNNTDAYYHNEALMLRWTPADGVEIMPFWQRSDGYDDDTGPIYIPAGDTLPPPVQRRQFDGPDWADYRGVASNFGVLAAMRPSPDWTIRAGVFRSLFDDESSFSHFLTDLTPTGEANRIIIADPPTETGSTSGEIRATHTRIEGPRLHLFHLSLKGRDRASRYGGSQTFDFGPTRLGLPFGTPEPIYAFGDQTEDSVRQFTMGLAYEGRWKGVGEIGIGLQKSDYRKTIDLPGIGVTETMDTPWLYDATAAYHLTDRLAVYGGYTRGLEESGVAPGNAVNRNEALPAILTSQRDFGLRYTLAPDLNLVAGLFEVEKPYFNLDQAGRFGRLGEVRNRGVELSLSGALTPELNIVAGAVLLDAKVTGEAVALGRVGTDPVGQTDTSLQLNLDWRPSGLENVSFDVALSHEGDVTATLNNSVVIPARTLMDVGGRYRFSISGTAATLRFAITNIFNEDGFDLRGSGAYDIIPGRVASLYLAMDF